MTLTSLGRERGVKASQERYGIKAVDRLLENRHLHEERVQVYSWLAQMVLSGKKRPVLLVDWSEVAG